MKTTLQAMLLLAIVLGWQACGSKSESNADSTTADNATTPAEDASSTSTTGEDVPNPEEPVTTPESTPESSDTYTSRSGKTVYNRVEVQPSYKGGNAAMVEYLKNNLSYPDNATEEGTLKVAFVVGDDGSVQDVEVIDGPQDPALREAAVRVVSAMPKWSPGTQGNKPVNVKFMVPLTFKK